MKKLEILLILLFLSSCDKSDNIENKSEVKKTEWISLPEDSIGYYEYLPNSPFETIERCWSIDNKFDCLYVMSTSYEDGSKMNSIRRYIKKKYNEDRPPVISDGYSCEIYIKKEKNGDRFTHVKEGIGKYINGHIKTVKYNESLFEYGQPIISRNEVLKFMKDNEIYSKNRYVNCITINSMIENEGIASILTTSLPYGIMTGLDDVWLYKMGEKPLEEE